jgi:hypothetical protein
MLLRSVTSVSLWRFRLPGDAATTASVGRPQEVISLPATYSSFQAEATKPVGALTFLSASSKWKL